LDICLTLKIEDMTMTDNDFDGPQKILQLPDNKDTRSAVSMFVRHTTLKPVTIDVNAST